MSTKRSIILAAVKSALTSISGVNDAYVYRSRVEALSRGECPAIVIQPVSDTPDNITVPHLLWSLIFQVEVIVRSQTPDADAEPILNDIHSKIMTDATLAGYAVQLVPVSLDWHIDEADKTLCYIPVQFRIDYQTNLTDISS